MGPRLGKIDGLTVEDENHTEFFPEHHTLEVSLTAPAIAQLVLRDRDIHRDVADVVGTTFSSSHVHGERLRLPVEPFFAEAVAQKSRKAALHRFLVLVTGLE